MTTILSPDRKKRRAQARKRQESYWQRKNGPVTRTPGIAPPQDEPIEDRRLPDEGKALGAMEH